MASLFDALDITLWQARMELPGAKKTLNYQSVTLVDSKQNPCGLILIERGASLTEKEILLLQSILATAGLALGAAVAMDQIDAVAGVVIVVSEANSIPAQLQEQLGDIGSKFTHLPHPSRCLISAESKRQAWSQLLQNGLVR